VSETTGNPSDIPLHSAIPNLGNSALGGGETSGNLTVEQIAAQTCEALFGQDPNYLRAFAFGTRETAEATAGATDEAAIAGNDLDLRLCFDRQIVGEEAAAIQQRFTEEMQRRGVDTDETPIDLFFMELSELTSSSGIRDLKELGPVEGRLLKGLNPKDGPAALQDTSVIGLYILETLRPIHTKAGVDPELVSPQAAIERLTLTHDGAIGYMHYYRAYHRHLEIEGNPKPDRIAKCLSRVVVGAVLAQLNPDELAIMKPLLGAAIRQADAHHATDETMARVLLDNPSTARLIDPDTRELLILAGRVRSNDRAVIDSLPADFVERASATTVAYSSQQGKGRRVEGGEQADTLNSLGMEPFFKTYGVESQLQPGERLIQQETGDEPPTDEPRMVYFIPYRNSFTGEENGTLDITVTRRDGSTQEMTRTPGRLVGDAGVIGGPRTATVRVSPGRPVSVIAVPADKLQALISSPEIREELRDPARTTLEARQVRAFIEYMLGEFNTYTAQSTGYTTRLADPAEAEARMGSNPFEQYNQGSRFTQALEFIAAQQPPAAEGDAEAAPPLAVEVTTGDTPTQLLALNQENGWLYVVKRGNAQATLGSGETVPLSPNEPVGEGGLFGRPTMGGIDLLPYSQAFGIHPTAFHRISQSTRTLAELFPGAQVPAEIRDMVGVDLLLSLAYTLSHRLRRRIATR
jgi:hypothetical protein